jgi:hypothetical protein
VAGPGPPVPDHLVDVIAAGLLWPREDGSSIGATHLALPDSTRSAAQAPSVPSRRPSTAGGGPRGARRGSRRRWPRSTCGSGLLTTRPDEWPPSRTPGSERLRRHLAEPVVEHAEGLLAVGRLAADLTGERGRVVGDARTHLCRQGLPPPSERV